MDKIEQGRFTQEDSPEKENRPDTDISTVDIAAAETAVSDISVSETTDAETFATDVSAARGYQRTNAGMTPAAEEYLETICRLARNGPVRIRELSERLRVAPSSASRMARQMNAAGYVDFKRYGYITLTEAGARTGEYFQKRRAVVRRFLELLKGTADERTETAQIERYVSASTVAAMENRISEWENDGEKSRNDA